MDEVQLRAELEAALASRDPEAMDKAIREVDRYLAVLRQKNTANDFLMRLRAEERNWYMSNRIDEPELAYLFSPDLFSLTPLGGKLLKGAMYAEDYRLQLMGPVQLMATGAVFADGSKLLSMRAGEDLSKIIMAREQLSLEAIVKPADLTHTGPARIIGISYNAGLRNFSLMQELTTWRIRLRTTGTDANGMPETSVPGLTTERTHIVITFDRWIERFYVNGAQVFETGIHAGSMSGWATNYPLVLGNEYLDVRNWAGTIRYMAFYSKALSAAQVAVLAASQPPGG